MAKVWKYLYRLDAVQSFVQLLAYLPTIGAVVVTVLLATMDQARPWQVFVWAIWAFAGALLVTRLAIWGWKFFWPNTTGVGSPSEASKARHVIATGVIVLVGLGLLFAVFSIRTTQEAPALTLYARGPVSAFARGESMFVAIPTVLGNLSNQHLTVAAWTLTLVRPNGVRESFVVPLEFSPSQPIRWESIEHTVEVSVVATSTLMATIAQRLPLEPYSATIGWLVGSTTTLRGDAMTNGYYEVKFKDNLGREHTARLPALERRFSFAPIRGAWLLAVWLHGNADES